MISFYSDKLARRIDFDAVQELSREELKTFHDELVLIVKALENTILDANQKQNASGIPLSQDWLHRVNTKKRIALKFAAEANSRLNGGSTIEQRAKYEAIYRDKFRAMLEEEFGPDVLKEIERELIDASRSAYKEWIASTNQTMWFVP